MVKTRHMRKSSARKKSLSRRRSMRRRVKNSACRKKGPAACRGTKGCKVASGRKRSFCRKARNTRRRQRGGLFGSGMGQGTPCNFGQDLTDSSTRYNNFCRCRPGREAVARNDGKPGQDCIAKSDSLLGSVNMGAPRLPTGFF